MLGTAQFGPNGEIGRRKGLKILDLWVCGFESRFGHQFLHESPDLTVFFSAKESFFFGDSQFPEEALFSSDKNAQMRAVFA